MDPRPPRTFGGPAGRTPARRRPLVLGAAALVVLAGCSSAARSAAPPTTTRPPSTTTTTGPALCPLTGTPVPGGGPGAGPPGTCGEGRQLPGGPTPVRTRSRRHRLRGAGGGGDHPVRRRVPVPGGGTGRPGPLGPQHRHRDPGPAGQPPAGPRGRDRPGHRQHQRLPTDQRGPRRPRADHPEPPRALLPVLDLRQHRRHVGARPRRHDAPTLPVPLLRRHAQGLAGEHGQHPVLGHLQRRVALQRRARRLPALLRDDARRPGRRDPGQRRPMWSSSSSR